MMKNHVISYGVIRHKLESGRFIPEKDCHKLHSACISTTSGPIFTNQVVLGSPKWRLSTYVWDIQKQQQTAEISGHQ